jgi:hypothetical protein
MFDDNDLHYHKDESDLSVECAMRGDDLPIETSFSVDADRNLVIALSPLPFKVAEDKMLDMAIAVSTLNYKFANGSFDYDFGRGRIYFRMTASYRNSTLSKDAFFYLFGITVKTVDEYNDKLMMLAKGMITLEKFIENI